MDRIPEDGTQHFSTCCQEEHTSEIDLLIYLQTNFQVTYFICIYVSLQNFMLI